MSSRPHDALFKTAFEAPAHAAGLLRAVLPRALADLVDWRSMRSERASFVDAKLADRHSDLLFSARLQIGNDVRLFFLLEHQSTSAAAMPRRALVYHVQIWERGRKDRPGARLPPGITVIISHGPGGWTGARRFEDLFDPAVLAVPALVDLVPRFSLIIYELEHLLDADLEARSLGAFQKLALWLLRDARDPERLLNSFDAWRTTMLQVLRGPSGIDAFATLVTYMFRVIDPPYQAELRARISSLDPYAKETAMTIADLLHEEGRVEGHAEGHAEGRREGSISTLRSLLLLKFRLPSLDPDHESRLRAATPEALDRYLRRVLVAETLTGVFDESRLPINRMKKRTQKATRKTTLKGS